MEASVQLAFINFTDQLCIHVIKLFFSIIFSLARDYGLQLVFHQRFHEFFLESVNIDNNEALLYIMNVINENGSISEDEWEAASKEENNYDFQQLMTYI